MSDHRHADSHSHSHGTGDAAFAEMLELDGEVLHAYWDAALTLVRQAAPRPTELVVDLGAGTGLGTVGLAQRFADAEIVAVDTSDEMLTRIRAKASGLGLASRVRTVQADLDDAWPINEPVDVTWASMSLHHLTDPDRVLRDVFTATRPGGLLGVAEFVEDLRFLPDDLGMGRPGLEARCLAVSAEQHTHSLPHLGADWRARIAAAGFEVVEERVFSIALDVAEHPAAARYAAVSLEHLRDAVAEHLDADDRRALAELLDGDGPESLQRRTDLRVRGSRTVTLGRRV